MAKSNFEKVEAVVGWVRDKKITGYRISKETNAREMSIIALAQGRAKVKNISFVNKKTYIRRNYIILHIFIWLLKPIIYEFLCPRLH